MPKHKSIIDFANVILPPCKCGCGLPVKNKRFKFASEKCSTNYYKLQSRRKRLAAESGCLLPTMWLMCSVCEEPYPFFTKDIQSARSSVCPGWMTGKNCGRLSTERGNKKYAGVKKNQAQGISRHKTFRETICHRDGCRICGGYARCSDTIMTGGKWEHEKHGRDCWYPPKQFGLVNHGTKACNI